MKKVVLLTGSELRHTFFRKYIATSEGIEVLASYCEGMERSVQSLVEENLDNKLRKHHLAMREQSEKNFFESFVEKTEDRSKPIFLPKGEINSEINVAAIISLNPDLLVAYGCSLIKGQLLTAFRGRFLNVHLGLSPYYRGSGTNYWPLVNSEPEYLGATFMHIDAGVDTGEIIHQIRARIKREDTPAAIGNRLIIDMVSVYRDIIVCFSDLKKMQQLEKPANEKNYRKKDFSEESVEKLYRSLREGMLDKYFAEESQRTAKVKIITNPVLLKRV